MLLGVVGAFRTDGGQTMGISPSTLPLSRSDGQTQRGTTRKRNFWEEEGHNGTLDKFPYFGHNEDLKDFFDRIEYSSMSFFPELKSRKTFYSTVRTGIRTSMN